jgi:hypothetical protein
MSETEEEIETQRVILHNEWTKELSLEELSRSMPLIILFSFLTREIFRV